MSGPSDKAGGSGSPAACGLRPAGSAVRPGERHRARHPGLVELAQPRKHVHTELPVGVKQIHHHPILSDQPVLDAPEVEAAHGDPPACRGDARPAVVGEGLDHVRAKRFCLKRTGQDAERVRLQ